MSSDTAAQTEALWAAFHVLMASAPEDPAASDEEVWSILSAAGVPPERWLSFLDEAIAERQAVVVELTVPASWRPTVDGYRRLLGVAWTRYHPTMDVETAHHLPDGRWTVRLSSAVSHTPGAAELAPGVASSSAKLRAALAGLEEAGHVVVGLDGSIVTTVENLDPLSVDLRDHLAAALRLLPWEVQITSTLAWQPLNGRPEPVRFAAKLPRLSQAPDDRPGLLAGLLIEFLGAPAAHRRWSVERLSDGSWQWDLRLDPLARVLPYAEQTLTPTAGSIPVGLDENGKIVELALIESNSLVAGLPGSGKSGLITAFLAGVSRLQSVALLGLDPKVVELASWSPRFSVIATEGDKAIDLLERLVTEMERRYAWLAASGKKKLAVPDLAELPLLVLVIDELADLVSVGVTKDEKAADQARASMIRRLIAKGRAAGISVLAATQKPQSDIVPTALRDLIQQRACFATSTREMTQTVLGSGIEADAHLIPPNAKGVGYVMSETERDPRRFRAFWVPDEDVPDLAAQTAHLRVDLPWLKANGSTPAGSDSPWDAR